MASSAVRISVRRASSSGRAGTERALEDPRERCATSAGSRRREIEAELAEPECCEPLAHRRQRGRLVARVQGGLALRDRVHDQVRDRLRLAGARRAVQDEARALARRRDGHELTGIRIERRDQGRQLRAPARDQCGGRGRWLRERRGDAFGEVCDHGTREQLLVGARVEILPQRHRREREHPDSHAALDAPAGPRHAMPSAARVRATAFAGIDQTSKLRRSFSPSAG